MFFPASLQFLIFYNMRKHEGTRLDFQCELTDNTLIENCTNYIQYPVPGNHTFTVAEQFRKYDVHRRRGSTSLGN